MKFAILAVFAILAAFTSADFLDCEMCDLAVKITFPLLGEDTEIIEKTFEADCKITFIAIPFAAQKCKKFVDSKLDPIIHELENGTAPKDVCKKLDMC